MSGFTFDATSIPPQQLGDRVPPGTYPAVISNTYGKKNSNTPGGHLVIEFTTPVGTISSNYNVFREPDKAFEIAQKQLSALCHATGVFKIDCPDSLPPEQYGRELRGAQLTIKVDLQDPTKPDGYTEVKKVFDRNGNEPGKTGTAPQPQQQSSGWGATQPQNNNPAPQNNNPAQQSGQWTQAQPPKQETTQQSSSGASAPPWAR